MLYPTPDTQKRHGWHPLCSSWSGGWRLECSCSARTILLFPTCGRLAAVSHRPQVQGGNVRAAFSTTLDIVIFKFTAVGSFKLQSIRIRAPQLYVSVTHTFRLFPLNASIMAHGWMTSYPSRAQVLGVAGLFLMVLQLGIIPHATEQVGIVKWQRVGCIVGVPAFLAVPCARLFSWSDTSLFVELVVADVLATCCLSAVSVCTLLDSQPGHGRP